MSEKNKNVVIEYVERKAEIELHAWEVELENFLMDHIRKINPRRGFNVGNMVKAIWSNMHEDTRKEFIERQSKKLIDGIINSASVFEEFLKIKEEMMR